MYIVLIYNHDEVVEDKKIKGLEEATHYGEIRAKELGEGYWFKVKAD